MKDCDVRLDLARPDRLNFDEAILCARKSDAQLFRIMDELLARGVSALMTRLESTVVARFSSEHETKLDYDPISRTGYFNWCAPDRLDFHPVAVVSAGSSDMPQAAEVIRTLTYLGVPAERFIDVGVAGLWRLLEEVDRLRTFPVVVAIAGMDGALPSVLGGLIPGSIICVPTSTGYGVSRNGETAFCAALSSCAPGLAVVNVDNGYGAACAAYRIVNMIKQCQTGSPKD
jgi:NCAIR mutase (PurE)-related protein